MTRLTDPILSRRRMLQLLAGGAAATAVSACSRNPADDTRSGAGPSAVAPQSSPVVAPAPVGERKLVVIELPGGNDSLSTLIPLESGRYHDLRPTLALSGEDVLPTFDGYGLNRALAGLEDRLAILAGVGAAHQSLSHFDMLARWWSGSTPGATASSGFLGRLCDRLGDGFTGVSIGGLPTPAMKAERDSTIGLPSAARLAGRPDADPGSREALSAALDAMGGGAGAADLGNRTALDQLDDVDALLAHLAQPSGGAAGAELAEFSGRARFACDLLAADVGIRVVHLQATEGPAFDTHDNHREAHNRAFGGFAEGLRTLADGLEAAGLTDQVLIATTSEFGRRAQENNGGLDHGAASCSLLLGPVHAGVHGEHPSLRDLDPDGNLVFSTSFDHYYATLAAWLDVEPASVLARGARPVAGLVAI